MPRGENPNSRANLSKRKEFNHDTALIANKRSQEVKKAYSSLTEALKEQCTPEVLEQLTDVLIKRAKQGNLKAFELVRDQLGEKPVEKVSVTTVNEGAVDKLKDELNKRRANNGNANN